MALRPDLVEVIHGLRQESPGCVDDEEPAPVLARLRAAVPGADLADVMPHAFGRGADGRIL
ncbi:hypothetical protein [Streptomyces sp. NPDC004284]|uniref:hypothetical protein n=1 Tax=Streptomyces sp. NPDC004284 TaxID=3364695 RepID=UPI0036A10578